MRSNFTLLEFLMFYGLQKMEWKCRFSVNKLWFSRSNIIFFKKISVTKTYVNLGLVCFQQSIGSQLWDAAFATQAVIASKLVDEYGSTLRRAHEFLKQSQVYSLVQKISYLLVHRSGIIAVIAVLTWLHSPCSDSGQVVVRQACVILSPYLFCCTIKSSDSSKCFWGLQEDASSHFQRSMDSLHQRSWLASLGLHCWSAKGKQVQFVFVRVINAIKDYDVCNEKNSFFCRLCSYFHKCHQKLSVKQLTQKDYIML
jgi:hypothetical protein